MAGRVRVPSAPDSHTADAPSGAISAGAASLWSPAALAKLTTILGRKWTIAVVLALYPGPIRHGDLCRRLSGIARKVLHDSLNGLIEDGLVEKTVGVDDVGVASVSYGLTPLGTSLAPVLDEMQIWCALHLDEVVKCRADGGAPIRVAGSSGNAVTSR